MEKLIVIADDHPLFRQALRETIAPIFSGAEIKELETLAETKQALAEVPVELMFLDLRMPDSDGLAGLMMIKSQHPGLPVIVVSASEEPEVVRAAIQAGASGYIFKSSSLPAIHDAVQQVKQGEVYVPAGVDDGVTENENNDLDTLAKLSSLTPAQLSVYILLARGLMNKQIAAEMFISEATVKAHVTSIYKKLGVRSRAQAVMVSKALEISKEVIRLG